MPETAEEELIGRADADRKKRRALAKKAIVAGSAFLLVLVLALVACFMPYERWLPAAEISPRRSGELRLHFLDVGQGNCTLVEFPDGAVLAVDGGDGYFSARNKINRYLRGLDCASLSLLATHADVDHYGGFVSVLENFDVETCYLPALPSTDEAYLRFLSAAEEEGCELRVLSRYDAIEHGEAAMICLSPYSAGETDENESACVLYLEYEGFRALLPSDITAARERQLVAEYLIDGGIFDSDGREVTLEDVDVFELAHHGSVSSNSEDWLALLSPAVAIVSCGRDNAYKHPAEEALANLKAAAPDSRLYRTDACGDVVVSVLNGTYTVTANGRE